MKTGQQDNNATTEVREVRETISSVSNTRGRTTFNECKYISIPSDVGLPISIGLLVSPVVLKSVDYVV